MSQSEAIGVVVFVLMIISFVVGAYVNGTYWQDRVIKDGAYEWTVDHEGKTDIKLKNGIKHESNNKISK